MLGRLQGLVARGFAACRVCCLWGLFLLEVGWVQGLLASGFAGLLPSGFVWLMGCWFEGLLALGFVWLKVGLVQAL